MAEESEVLTFALAVMRALAFASQPQSAGVVQSLQRTRSFRVPGLTASRVMARGLYLAQCNSGRREARNSGRPTGLVFLNSVGGGAH